MSDINAEIPTFTSLPNTLLSMSSGGGTGGADLLSGLYSGLAAELSQPPNSIIDSTIQALQSANTTITNDITNAAANAYAIPLPTADIANTLVTTVPSYDANLFLSGVAQAFNDDPANGLIYTFGAPAAASTALYTLAGGFELEVLLDAL